MYFLQASFVKLVSFKWWFTTISAKATTVLLGPSHSGPSAEVFPPIEQGINITLCSIDHLALHLQAQAVCDVPDLVDVGKHLVMAAEVPVEDHGGTIVKALSENSVARAALAGRKG